MNKTQREEQRKENEKVKAFYEAFTKKYSASRYLTVKSNQLRQCNARVYHFEDFEILQSYSTVIAIYDRTNEKIYDFLRYVYGYTRSSAQQISKFMHDYTGYTVERLTYKTV